MYIYTYTHTINYINILSSRISKFEHWVGDNKLIRHSIQIVTSF